jgi:hypothetical protein
MSPNSISTILDEATIPNLDADAFTLVYSCRHGTVTIIPHFEYRDTEQDLLALSLEIGLRLADELGEVVIRSHIAPKSL